MFVSHLYVFFGEMSVQFFGPFFLIGSFIILELSCMSCLYIFEIICLSVASFAIIDFIFKKSYRSVNKLSIILFLMEVYHFFKRKGNEGRREQGGRPGEGHYHITLNSSMLYLFLTCSVYQPPKTGTHTGLLTSSNETES